MSAGQPRKRPTSASLPPDHHRSRPKRPRLDPAPLLSFSSRVRLRWDGASRRVAPAEDQIGIPWSRLAPFVDAPPPRRRRASRLADVASVPTEVFALENLRRVLSYEVWDKFLTEADMKLLAQFLPTGTNTEEAVHALLTGKNHHFGNPLLTWSSALCYGDLHPDAVLAKDQQIRADMKAYRAQISDYHSDMTEVLTRWKEKWLICENPETMFRDKPAKLRRGDLQSRGENVRFSNSPSNPIPMKVVRNGDVTKFMSYIKITKSQHELVKRMKQSGDGIQTKLLTSVIGDIDNFHVKPYETLMEDEKKKLHAYWAILSSKELPAAFEARRERMSMFENLRTSLCLEFAERSLPAGEEEKAEQVAERATYQNGGGISDEEEEPVDRSPEENSSAVPEAEAEADDDTSDTDTSTENSHDSTDRDAKGTSDTGTPTDSHASPHMSDQDATDMNNANVTAQSPSSRDEGDQEHENISSSDGQDDDMEDTGCKDFVPGAEVGDDDMEETGCEGTAVEDDNNIPDMQAQEPKAAISHTISPPVHGLDESPNVLVVQDRKKFGYTGFPIHVGGGFGDQADGLNNPCYSSASAGHGVHVMEMNGMVLDQRGSAVMTSDSTLLATKHLCRQNTVEEVPVELKGGPAKYQEALWQSASPVVDSLYRPPGNGSLYAQSGALQHHLSGGPATSVIDLEIDDRLVRQPAKMSVTPALPVRNPASLPPPCTSQLTSGHLLNGTNGIGTVPSYSVGHMNNGMKQSVALHSMTNGHLAQSGLVLHSMTNGHLASSGLVPEQMQLLGESHNGLHYSQQVENNMFSGTFPVGVPQNLGDRSSSWFPSEQPSHNNNWSSGMVLGQDLPSGDGSLSSVLSQYRQVSSPLPIPNQFIGGGGNLVPPHIGAGAAVNPALGMYGYTQNNMTSSNPVPRSQADGGSLQWVQGSHGNGMAHPPFRQFGGDPWSR